MKATQNFRSADKLKKNSVVYSIKLVRLIDYLSVFTIVELKNVRGLVLL